MCDFMIALTVFVSGHHGLNTFLLHLLLIGSVGGVAGQPCHRFLQIVLVAVIHVSGTLGSFTRDTMDVFQGFCTAVDRRLVLPLVHPAGVLAPSAMTSVLHKESKFISGCLPTTHCPADEITADRLSDGQLPRHDFLYLSRLFHLPQLGTVKSNYFL